MKKNLLFVVVLVAAVALLASCKKKEISMTPETTKVSGSLAACFEVVDEPVKVALKDGKLDEMESVWSVKLRRTDAPLPFKEDSEIAAYGVFRTDGKAYYNVGFGLKVTDAGGNTVQDAKANASGFEGPYSYEDIDALFELNPGETGEIRWTVDSRCQDAKEPLKFTISSAYNSVDGYGGNSGSCGEAGSGDVDALLNQFENTINRLSKLNWLDDNYDAVEKQAINLYDKLIDMEMSSEQEKRFEELNKKFDKA